MAEPKTELEIQLDKETPAQLISRLKSPTLDGKEYRAILKEFGSRKNELTPEERKDMADAIRPIMEGTKKLVPVQPDGAPQSAKPQAANPATPAVVAAMTANQVDEIEKRGIIESNDADTPPTPAVVAGMTAQELAETRQNLAGANKTEIKNSQPATNIATPTARETTMANEPKTQAAQAPFIGIDGHLIAKSLEEQQKPKAAETPAEPAAEAKAPEQPKQVAQQVPAFGGHLVISTEELQRITAEREARRAANPSIFRQIGDALRRSDSDEPQNTGPFIPKDAEIEPVTEAKAPEQPKQVAPQGVALGHLVNAPIAPSTTKHGAVYNAIDGATSGVAGVVKGIFTDEPQNTGPFLPKDAEEPQASDISVDDPDNTIVHSDFMPEKWNLDEPASTVPATEGKIPFSDAANNPAVIEILTHVFGTDEIIDGGEPIKQAQRLLGIPDDGKIGPVTRQAFADALEGTEVAKTMQRNLGFQGDDVDGIIGTNTRQAAKDAVKNFEVVGIINRPEGAEVMQDLASRAEESRKIAQDALKNIQNGGHEITSSAPTDAPSIAEMNANLERLRAQAIPAPQA